MKSKFIQDIEKISSEIVEKMPDTGEKGMIMLAMDSKNDGGAMVCIAADSIHRKTLLKLLLLNKDIQQDIKDLVEGHEDLLVLKNRN